MLISICVVVLVVGAYLFQWWQNRGVHQWFTAIWSAVGDQVEGEEVQAAAFGSTEVTVENAPLGIDPEEPTHHEALDFLADAMAECWIEELACTHGCATIFDTVTVFRFQNRELMAEQLGLRSAPDEPLAEPEALDEEPVEQERGPDVIWNIYSVMRWFIGLTAMLFVIPPSLVWLWKGWFGPGRPYSHLSIWRRLQLFPIAVWAEFVEDDES